MSGSPPAGPEAAPPPWLGRLAFLVGLLVLLVVLAILYVGIGLLWRADGVDTFARRLQLTVGLAIAFAVGAMLWHRRTVHKRTR